MSRLQLTALGLLACLIFVGCGQSTTNQYGSSSGAAGRKSLNGFGALRRSYEQAGYSTRDVFRLTERVTRSNVIVWTPQVPQTIAPDVTRWFDRWLRRGGRTLVYIVPDSGSETQYWIDASRLAPPKQRLEYRRRLARSRSQRMQWTINRRSIPSNGWFVLEPSSELSTIQSLSGDWDLSDAAGSNEQVRTEYRILDYDPKNPGSNSTGATSGGTGPGSPSYVYYGPTEVSKTKVEVDSLLDSQTGDAIVAQVTSRNWKNSKIIVVSGGSLLTNYAFTRDFGVRLASTLVSASSPTKGPGAAGFLTSNMMPIPISERERGVPKASGMELLTVWPISLVTIHAALLGFVICMILLPVFGRPRKVDRGTTSNFGDHLDAVAALMNRAGGERFARTKISEYMRRMHGETSGPWILPETSTVELLPALDFAMQSASLDQKRRENEVPPPNDQPDLAGGMEGDAGKVRSSTDSGMTPPSEDSSDDEASR